MDTQIQHIGTLNKNFQSTDPAERDDGRRAYFEGIALQTKEPNSQNYRFMPESIEVLTDQYAAGVSVKVMHATWGMSALGFGKTIRAGYDETNLIVQFYVMRGQSTPAGPYGDTDQLITAMRDGTAKDLSVGVSVSDGRCSICGGDYFNYETCSHLRGGKYPVRNETGEEVLTECIVLIYAAEANELSIVDSGADASAEILQEIHLQAITGAKVDSQKYKSIQQASILPRGDTPVSVEETEQMNDQTATLQAQIDSLNAQLSAKNAEIEAMKTAAQTVTQQIEQKDAELAELRTKVQSFEVLARDGQAARDEALEANSAAFTKAHPDMGQADLSAELETRKEGFKTAALSQIRANTKIYNDEAMTKYPEGRATTDNIKTEAAAQSSRQRPRSR